MNNCILRLVLLSAAVIKLPSLCSGVEDGELNRTTIVCSTVSGNGSHASCTVPYNNTELVLSCDNEAWDNQTFGVGFRSCWTKDGCSGGQWLGQGINYTVNPDRRLTNADSALYCCTAWGPQYSYIDVNVHAPPELINVYMCEGVEKSHCHAGEKDLQYSIDAPPVQIVVDFTGNGPFFVQWLHNNTEFNCSNSIIDCFNTSSNNSQTLSLKGYSAKEKWMISGNYTAVVSNPYGRNSSTTIVQYKCIPSDTEHQKNQMVTLDLRDGMALNYTFCELVGPKYFDVVVCLTRNTSERLERLLHYSPGSCVRFTNGDCVQPFNGSIAKMQVSMLENNTDRCYPTQHVHFVKSRVSLHDNGIWILGGYWVGSRIIQYCSVHLGVSSRVNPCPLWVKIIIVVVFIVFAAVVTLAIVVFCRWYHKRNRGSKLDSTREKRNSVDEHRTLLTNMSESENEQICGDELGRPLLNRSRAHPQRSTLQPIGSPYSQALDEQSVCHGNYSQSLDGPRSFVFLH